MSDLRPPASSGSRDLTREFLRVLDEERERLAREIHDELAQELFALRLLAQSLSQSLSGEAGERARQVGALAEKAEQTARDLARNCSSLVGKGGCFAEFLRELADRHAGKAVFAVTGVRETRLADEPAAHLRRIVQEAVTNAIRHGNASHLRIALHREHPSWQVIIEDNGNGFDPENCPRGMGLVTMAYRAGQIGGVLSVERGRGGGMRVVCRFPPCPASSEDIRTLRDPESAEPPRA